MFGVAWKWTRPSAMLTVPGRIDEPSANDHASHRTLAGNWSAGTIHSHPEESLPNGKARPTTRDLRPVIDYLEQTQN